jgi:hypothetical protein
MLGLTVSPLLLTIADEDRTSNFALHTYTIGKIFLQRAAGPYIGSKFSRASISAARPVHP